MSKCFGNVFVYQEISSGKHGRSRIPVLSGIHLSHFGVYRCRKKMRIWAVRQGKMPESDCQEQDNMVCFYAWETREPRRLTLLLEGLPSRRKKGGRCQCMLHMRIYSNFVSSLSPLWDCVIRSSGEENSRHYSQ